MTTQPKPQTAVVRKPAATIRSLIEGEQFRQQLQKSLPNHLKPDRFIRIALTTMTKTPKLAQCDQASFFNALLTLSQLGIEPDGRRAHLIPFGNQCQLIVDYKGLAELAMRSGIVASLHADVVRENDVFEYDCGEIKTHKIDFKKPRGAVYAVYAICRLKEAGTVPKCEVMDVPEIEAVRKRSRAGTNGPWVTDWNEMAKKTVFRRLSKWLPLSAEYRDASDADDDNPTVIEHSNTPKSLVEVVRDFEPESVDVVQEDDVPMDVDPETRAIEPKKPALKEAVQDQLAKLVTDAGYTFDQLVKWGEGSGSFPDLSSYPTFGDIPAEVCARLLRAKAGLLPGLEAAKGGV